MKKKLVNIKAKNAAIPYNGYVKDI